MKIVPDTSILIEGILSERIQEKKYKPKLILIHEAVIGELENQANKNREIGNLGLEEISKLKAISKKFKFEVKFTGERPHASVIKGARIGEVDAIIRKLAEEEGAYLFTADKVQAKVGEVKGLKVILEVFELEEKPLVLEKFFDDKTMSVHLRENVCPFAKKGMPGNWEFVQLRKEKLTREELKEMHSELIDEANNRIDGFIEIERQGSTIVQIGRYRIVITRPPLSDGWEITAVRPVKILELKDYKLSEKLLKRISDQAEGVLIAGSPGMGKSTFAQALATFYASKGKIVKTIEAPRDLQLGDNITQYAISRGNPQEIQDILLLSRPDYTIFDEMRNTSDFRLFADMRLAGIGLAGVVHATNPIDAIQRFVGRIELGVIPQVIDTVIFIKNGTVFKLLSLKMQVKVPSGMTEADLARPVVVVNDFETNNPEFELYSYGEETVVIPVSDDKTSSPKAKLAAQAITDFFQKYSRDIQVEVPSEERCIVYVPERMISKIIGKAGKNIEKIEQELGISIDIRDLVEEQKYQRKIHPLEFDYKPSKKRLIFIVSGKYANQDVDLFVGGELLLSAKLGKDAKLKINRNSDVSGDIIYALKSGREIILALKR